MPLRCSVVIPTLGSRGTLAQVLRCLAAQTRSPHEVIVAVAGPAEPLVALAQDKPFPVRILACAQKSAAEQRNRGAAAASGDVLAFLDDDIEFEPQLFSEVLALFETRSEAELGALSPRISGYEYRRPGRLTRCYYRVQAGYAHEHYGGRLFGPGINCLPVFSERDAALVAAEWLPSGCLFIRAPLFARHRFPAFPGYSFAEDVHLTARARRDAPAFFLRDQVIVHHAGPSEFSADACALTAGKLHNMAVLARDVLGLHGWSLWWRWHLHRMFILATLLAQRPPRWRDELRGVLKARP